MTTLYKNLTTAADARFAPLLIFSRLQLNHLDTRGLNSVDRLLWACAMVVAGAEGVLGARTTREGQLTFLGSSKLATFFGYNLQSRFNGRPR